METLNAIQERNRALARSINDEARANPQSRYAGKFVGLANGQVAVVADSLDEMAKKLRQIEQDQRRLFGIEAGLDYDTPQFVWGVSKGV